MTKYQQQVEAALRRRVSLLEKALVRSATAMRTAQTVLVASDPEAEHPQVQTALTQIEAALSSDLGGPMLSVQVNAAAKAAARRIRS